MSDDFILGIDLGTTFSVAAYVDEMGRPQVIPNAEGKKTTPSVVLIENGQVLVGEMAYNQAILKHDNVVQWIKRSMDRPDLELLGMNPITISAEILKKIKEDSEIQLGVPLHIAVITCPAYFSAVEVESTMRAGELAGFDVREIVREPTAAAVYWGVQNLSEGDRLLVCDLGGGTYDASIVTLADGSFVPLATAGDRQLGGHDFTCDLKDYVAERLADIFGENPCADVAVDQQLYINCERLKRDFATVEAGSIACTYHGQTADVKVSRAEFERLVEWRIDVLKNWTQAALTKPKEPLTWDDINHILLVGGSTRLRRVPAALAELSGKQPVQTGEADTMVALGAAILASGRYQPRRATTSGVAKVPVSGITFKRIAERNLGTRVIDRPNGHWIIRNSIIIPYGTEIPVELTQTTYRTAVASQPSFDIPVVEFDGLGPDAIQDTWRFTCPKKLPRNTPIHVTFRYDISGRIEVEAVEQHSQKNLSKERVGYEEPDMTKLPAAPASRDIVFALDISGSMSGDKIVKARNALIQHAHILTGGGIGQVRVGVVVFGTNAEQICGLVTDGHAIEQGVMNAQPYGSTAMHAAINEAYQMLRGSKNKTAIREIVIVSDGMPDDQQAALNAASLAQKDHIQISILGIQSGDIDEAFLKTLTPNILMVENNSDLAAPLATLLAESEPADLPQSGITWLGGNPDGSTGA